MTEWIVASSIGFVCGGVVIWFAKDQFQKLVIGANALSAKLHAKANAIEKAV